MPFYTQLNKSHPAGSMEETIRKRTIAGIKALRTAFASHFPTTTDRTRTVRIGTWNLREFGGTKHGGRDTYEPLYYIAEIIAQFDIVALQEVREDLAEFHRLRRILGPDWDYLATDVTGGGPGNGERMVFLYNTTRARFANIAGELTLPEGSKVLASFGERILLENGIKLRLPAGVNLSGQYAANSASKTNGKVVLEQDLEIPLPANVSLELPLGSALALAKGTEVTRVANKRGHVQATIPTGTVEGSDFRLRFPGSALDDSFKQFARTPYLVAFQAGWLQIELATVHIYFGSNEEPALLAQRKREIERLTEALGKRAEKALRDDPDNPVITAVLGDFNILSAEHETMQALEQFGFAVPDEIKQIPGSNVDRTKAYDQIAFWEPRRNRGHVKVEIRAAGVFDYYEHVFTTAQHAAGEYEPGRTPTSFKDWRTYKMSDHLPMWIELTSDFSEGYLAKCEALTG